MLELCRAIVVAPTPFDARTLGEVATQVGFGDIVSIFDDSESNGLKYAMTYFLVHHRLDAVDCEHTVTAVRRIARNGLCYSPLIMMIDDAPSEAALWYVRMGFDDVVTLPQDPHQLARRLEAQLDTDIVYFETADYLGPDRRRMDPEATLRRPVAASPHTQLVIRRDPDFGTRVLSRHLRSRQHFEAAPLERTAAPRTLPGQARSFGKRLQPPVPGYQRPAFRFDTGRVTDLSV